MGIEARKFRKHSIEVLHSGASLRIPHVSAIETLDLSATKALDVSAIKAL